MDNLQALTYCQTCREPMITENGVPKCFNCAAPKKQQGLVKPPPAIDIPNEAEFRKVVKGVAKVEHLPQGRTANDALDIMKNLPMPKDMKEFKQIQKIIKQLEKLVGEDNGN